MYEPVDHEYHEFVRDVTGMPPRLLQNLEGALEGGLRKVGRRIAAARKRGDRSAEARLLADLIWLARRLILVKALLVDELAQREELAKKRDSDGGGAP
jgi:hypothetical protein